MEVLGLHFFRTYQTRFFGHPVSFVVNSVRHSFIVLHLHPPSFTAQQSLPLGVGQQVRRACRHQVCCSLDLSSQVLSAAKRNCSERRRNEEERSGNVWKLVVLFVSYVFRSFNGFSVCFGYEHGGFGSFAQLCRVILFPNVPAMERT